MSNDQGMIERKRIEDDRCPYCGVHTDGGKLCAGCRREMDGYYGCGTTKREG